MQPRRHHALPIGLLIACVLYVVLRGLILHTAFDDVCIPIFELPGVGMIPKIALDGWRGPPARAYYDNCGGLISTGVLAIPFYALLGASYWTLKLVPATLGFGALLLLWRYLDRNGSRAAANAAALLFALAPPTLAKYSLIAQGNHFENLIFQLVVVTAFAAAQHRPERRGRLFGFGVACGFATFTYFGSLAIVALTSLLHLVLRGPKRTLRDLGYGVPGFLLGLGPLIWVALEDGRPQRAVMGLLTDVGERTTSPVEQLGRFAREILPDAGCFEAIGPVPGRIGDTLFLVAFLGSWSILLPGVLGAILRCVRGWGKDVGDAAVLENFQRLRQAPYVLYFPTMLAVVAFGDLHFSKYEEPLEFGGYRYLVPHFMYATMVIGAAVVWLARSPSSMRRALGATLGGLALASVPFVLPVVDWSFEKTGRGPGYRGYWMPYYSGVALRGQERDPQTMCYTWDFDEVLPILDEFPSAQRQEIVIGVGYHLAMARDLSPGHRGAPTLEELVEPFPESDRVSLARGVGSYFSKVLDMRKGRRKRFEAYVETAVENQHPLLPHLLEGLSIPLAFAVTNTLEWRFQRSRSLGRSVPRAEQEHWKAGRGLAFGRLAGRAQPADDEQLAQELQLSGGASSASFWRGVGGGIASQADPAEAALLVARWVPADRRTEALLGLGREMRRYFAGTVQPAPWADEHLGSEADRSAFLTGWGS